MERGLCGAAWILKPSSTPASLLPTTISSPALLSQPATHVSLPEGHLSLWSFLCFYKVLCSPSCFSSPLSLSPSSWSPQPSPVPMRGRMHGSSLEGQEWMDKHRVNHYWMMSSRDPHPTGLTQRRGPTGNLAIPKANYHGKRSRSKCFVLAERSLNIFPMSCSPFFLVPSSPRCLPLEHISLPSSPLESRS